MTDEPYVPDPPLPMPLLNAFNGPYWSAAAEGLLLLLRSRKTGEIWRPDASQLDPLTLDPAEVEWFEASGKGEVHSFRIIHRTSVPGYSGRTPFIVALVSLEEGARMMANIIGPNALKVAVGDKVRCVFEARGEGVNVPQFVLERR